MTPQPTRLPFVPRALAASKVGVWEFDVTNDTMRCCSVLASMLDVAALDGEQGIPIQRFAQAVHTEDRGRLSAQHAQLCERGGFFTTNYRLATGRDHHPRPVLARGRYDIFGGGEATVARGVIIDLDGCAAGGSPAASDRSLDARAAEDRAATLDLLAGHAVAASYAIGEIGDAGRQMRPLIELLLLIVGREIEAALRPD